MKRTTPIAIAAILTACGAAATNADNAANTNQSARRGGDQQRELDAFLKDASGMQSAVDGGGAPGCFDPSLTGRERAVAERLGAVPCPAPSGDAAALASGGDNWAGRYVGPFDGGQGEVAISLEPNRLYSVNMSVAGNGCSGQASGFNAPRGNVLALHVQTGNAVDGAGECRITMTRQGDTLRVSESGSCTELHGMSCGFSGSATRRGATATATSIRPAAQRASWIVGAWAMDRRECSAVAALTLRGDGTYSTESEQGSWQLDGNSLTFLPRATYIEGGDSTPIRNSRPFRHQVLAPRGNALSLRAPGGSVSNFVRCG
ncbi:MAG: hypothetical protein QOD42_1893 [Sphingomonadales bacterium]|jgi:hypothetical protein|nr:hypothetical protein [Sphingomonadales bacterium]